MPVGLVLATFFFVFPAVAVKEGLADRATGGVRKKSDSSVTPYCVPQHNGTVDEFGYRFGDVVRGWMKNVVDGNFRRQYPCSIALAYSKRTNRTCDWGVLSALVDEYQSTTENSLPDDSTLVVHLRLGDNVAQSRNHSEVIAAQSRNESIVLPALPDNVRKVTIVGSLGHIKDSDKHAARKRQMSMDYIGAVRRAWMDAGLATDVRMDHEVDADFVYMSHARHFVYGFRGFSAVVAGTVYYRGGTVYHAAAAYDFLSSSSRLTTLTRRQSGFLAGGCAAPWLRASALSGGP